jgi:hypothetical protein
VWASSSTNVLTIDGGNAVAVGVGTATLLDGDAS